VTGGPVLLCFDGSDEAAEAIHCASVVLATREAIVLTVATPAKDEFPFDPAGDLVGRLSGLYRDWDEIATELAERHAREGCELASGEGFTARSLTASGKPAAAILRVANEQEVSVIVLGAGRRGALGGLLGSVSARVAERAAQPVLVIPRH
jgi:nucleotide-binding universal stress UspA family protein